MSLLVRVHPLEKEIRETPQRSVDRQQTLLKLVGGKVTIDLIVMLRGDDNRAKAFFSLDPSMGVGCLLHWINLVYD